MPKLLKKKAGRNGDGRAGLRGVGPAFDHIANSPAGELDRADAAQNEEHREWSDMRSMFVKIGKRMGVVTEKVEGTRAAPSSSGDEDDLKALGRTDFVDDVLAAPFSFEVLCRMHENSSALRQNIDAFATNVDGFGHRFVPVLDFKSPEINNDVKDVMVRERLDEIEPPVDDLMTLTKEDLDALVPGIEEVEKQRALWEQIATLEKGRVESFFEFINPLKSFVEIRLGTRETRELLGNAGWEVIREDPADVTSKVCQVYTIPFVNVRLMRSDRKPTTVEMKVRKDKIHFETIEVDRFFRRFVRSAGSMKIYYKEFGDPRAVSRESGRQYKDADELKAAEPDAKLANEMFHWDIPSQLSPYGVPRWIGATLSVLGSRASEEVNFLYFDNKAIPPMVMLVSGGRVSSESISKLESYIEDRIKGRTNFHKIMIIEGLPADADESSGDTEHSGKVRIELKPLMGDQMQDGLFQQYDANNIIKIGRSFRQPAILTGDTRDMNRATAEVAKAFAEEQIYQPARDAFDATMDRHFLVNIGIHFWRFKTNAPVQRIPNDLVKNVKASLDSGAMTPNEGRKLLEDAFSMELEHRTEDWAEVPPKLALVAARQGMVPSAETTDTGLEDASVQVEGVVDGDPAIKRSSKRANNAVLAVAYLRRAVGEAIEQAKDEFFDGSAFDDDTE